MAEQANVLGSGTGAINLTVGVTSASPGNGPVTTGSAGAIFVAFQTGLRQQVNVLNGATNGYIYAAPAGGAVLTVGTGGGTGGNLPALSA